MLEIKHFPEDMSTFEVDKSDVASCFVSGLFEETVEVDGVNRRFYTYLKPKLHYNRPCLVVAIPSGHSVADYLENSFWIEFADKNELFLHIVIPEGQEWNLDGTDADYMNKVYIQIQSRRYYVTMQDNIYALGLGDGATVAQQAAMKMSSEWAGLATFGDLDAQAMLNADVTHGGHNTGKTELVINAVKAQLPVWMAWSKSSDANAAVKEYWQEQNGTAAEKLSNRWADEIYLPNSICKTSQLNEEAISQVRITNGYEGQLGEDFLSAVWDYLSKACRHRGFGKKMLRNRIDPIAYDAKLCTMEWDGFTRRWYEYVPESVKKNNKPVPLVICMHGRGGTAESFLSLSGMSRVAEERDFIVIFPEAGVYQQRPGGLRNILLWNGSYQEKKIDDVGFVLKIIEGAKERYNIDASRIYACGQSSGGMMTSELALRAPEVFAAVSPWSAIKDPDHDVPLPEAINPPVPYMFLLGENDWLCVDRKNGQLDYSVTPDIASFLKNLMKLYRLDEKPLRYTCGEISYYVYMNPKRIPMLVVGTVREMSHANYPRESWIAYDEFLSKFSKAADNTLLYMGEPIV